MLSAEKAKFKSAFDNTNNHMHNDNVLNKKPAHTFGILISWIINCNIFLMLAPIVTSKELMLYFKKIWLIVSQRPVRTIKNKIKITPVVIF